MRGRPPRAPAARWQSPILGAALLVATVYAVALIGAVSARVAPLLLSPPASERLAAVQARADQLMQRNRLAADLHDSIGHALSVVALQAGAAARVIDHDPRFARQALDAIAEQARTATGELDHVLGVLREERPTTAAPRTLVDLPHLVEAARTAGAVVRWERTGPIADVPPVVSREAYRLCQEGLTNALRHGDRSAPITVEVHVDEDRLRISIANRIPARRGRAAGGGRGLPGLAERFSLLGGALASTEHDLTWRLDAEVPWGSAR